jgi:hypothetical protein
LQEKETRAREVYGTAVAEKARKGVWLLMRRLSPVGHARFVEVQVEAGLSSLVLRW